MRRPVQSREERATLAIRGSLERTLLLLMVSGNDDVPHQTGSKDCR